MLLSILRKESLTLGRLLIVNRSIEDRYAALGELLLVMTQVNQWHGRCMLLDTEKITSVVLISTSRVRS